MSDKKFESLKNCLLDLHNLIAEKDYTLEDLEKSFLETDYSERDFVRSSHCLSCKHFNKPEQIEPKKVIFLDIDGVLNHILYYKEKSQSERAKEVGYPESEIDPDKLKLLNKLISETGALIVISSTWRRNKNIDYFKKIFSKRGFEYPDNIIGLTPILSYNGNQILSYNGKTKKSVMRGAEILEWIEQNIKHEEQDDLRYVILDDDSDMLYWQRNNFLLVDGFCGLTPNITYKAKYILNGNKR